MSEELFPVVDEAGNVLDCATRKECHSGSMLLHPVVHLHVVDRQSRILLQRRSKSKDIQPGKWDTAVGGHVDFGEDVFTALLRESQEELGIDASKAQHLESYVFQSSVERELVNTFMLIVDNPATLNLKIDPIEIDETRFWTAEEIDSAIDTDEFTPNFLMEYRKIYPAIKSRL